MKDHLKSVLPGIFLAGVLLSGCSQKDSAVGLDLVPGLTDVYPEEMTLYPSSSAFYQEQMTTGSSPFLYIGHAEGYDANTLLKFNPYGALPDSFTVDSLAVKLYLDSVIVAGSSELEVDVIFINRSQTWADVGVTWDNMDSLELGDPVTTFEIPAVTADSDSVSFCLPAPDSLLRAWEWAGSGGKTLHYNNGLYLKSEKAWDQMVRFGSAENSQVPRRPRLEMYVTFFDTSDTTGAPPVDTMLYLYAGGDAFIARYQGILDSTNLYLGNAVACRSILRFNLEGLFPTYGIGVHRAEITLHADTTSEFNLGAINSAYQQEMQDTSWMQDPAAAPIKFVTPIFGYYDEDEATLSLVLTEMVYNWIQYPETNYGFLIRSSSELYDISRTVFYGINAPDSLRPSLRIVYLVND